MTARHQCWGQRRKARGNASARRRVFEGQEGDSQDRVLISLRVLRATGAGSFLESSTPTTAQSKGIALFMKVALVIGTRPEAIKMAPVVRALRNDPATEPILISTGQHRELLTGTLESLAMVPDHDLALMTDSQTPNGLSAQILQQLPEVFHQVDPAAVLVQGDTTTAMAAGLAAFHQQTPVGHIEAGLRTGDLDSPFPEEGNRLILDRIARWCFAPTAGAADNLRAESIDADRIVVTGNTGIDSLLWMLAHPETVTIDAPSRDFILLTLHRRESFGAPLRAIVHGVCDFLQIQPEASVVWPMHPNPNVRAALEAAKSTVVGKQIQIVPPPAYGAFCQLLAQCRLVLSDSGGVQEECPSLGKRVLVARETTERPEAIDSGHNLLVGRERAAVSAALEQAWHEPIYDGPIPAPNPYGDGQAAERILSVLKNQLLRC